MKAAMGILTTDLKPKVAMEECKIGNTGSKNLWNCKRIRHDLSKYGNNT